MFLAVTSAFLAGCVRFQDRPLSAETNAGRLEARNLQSAEFRSFIETNLGRTVAEWPLTNLDFEVLTLAAFYFHPSLDIARAQWAVAGGAEATAGARPNPVLAVVPGYSANAPKGVSPWFPSVTLDVPIETAGKRRYRMDHAQHLSEAARLNISVVAWQVRSDVRAALVDYAMARKRVEALGQNVGRQQRVTELLEQRLAAGVISAPEISAARIALLKVRSGVAVAQRQTTEARAKIAESIGVPVHALAGMEFSYDLNQLTDPSLMSAEARREALLGRADVLAALAEYAASQSALQVEIAKQYPDLHFNPGYQYDQGENKWSLGLSVELPVLYRNQGGIAEAHAKRDEAAARFNALQVKIISEIDRSLLSWTAATQQVSQIEELSRALKQQAEQVQAAFNAGAADQLEIANSQLEFATIELSRLEALAKAQQAAGQLEDALQRPLEAVSRVERDPKNQSARNP